MRVLGADDGDVAVEVHGAAKVVRRIGVGREQLGDEGPSVGAVEVLLEDIGRAGCAQGLVVAVGADDHRVMADGDCGTEEVADSGVGCDELLDLLHQSGWWVLGSRRTGGHKCQE